MARGEKPCATWKVVLLTVGDFVAFGIAYGLVKNKADELPGAPRWWLEKPGDTCCPP
jgi:hypothetical protein